MMSKLSVVAGVVAIVSVAFGSGAPVVTTAGSAEALWTLSDAGDKLPMGAPVFEIAGKRCVAVVEKFTEAAKPRRLANGATEYVCDGKVKGVDNVILRFVYRIAPDSPVVRFRYELRADRGEFRLTRTTGRDAIEYLRVKVAPWQKRTEVRLGEFYQESHSWRLSEHEVRDSAFEDAMAFIGPMLAVSGKGTAALVAYEHGSQTPDAFIEFAAAADFSVAVRAVKGNYYGGYRVTPEHPFESVWFDVALVKGGEDELAAAFRDFQLRRCSPNAASRKPWIYYNTWALQERDYWWYGSRDYLRQATGKRMLEDIDIAHRVGIDVYVVDTGWYEKTGDWRVSKERFPEGLKPLVDKLNGYGMKLGLWFSPTQAAESSMIAKKNQRNVMSWKGEKSMPYEVWQTEKSRRYCLVSPYWKDVADEFIRCYREFGCTYFKWDAIGQYGCDSPDHCHGDSGATPQERADCYAFEQVRYMAKIIDRVCEACPEAIVDFDVTEAGRTVGLAFLASGKFFANNNGPYRMDLDDDECNWQNPKCWVNYFTHPGGARARLMRKTLDYDRWIPSVLFLSHYLPDEPRFSQRINLGSLILGQNGIWGDLQKISPAGVKYMGDCLAAYKRVRDDITAANPVRVGELGGSPEIHEKLNANGRGAVVIFVTEVREDGSPHTVYVTENRAGKVLWKTDGTEVTYDARGRAIIKCDFVGPERPSAAIVLFE